MTPDLVPNIEHAGYTATRGTAAAATLVSRTGAGKVEISPKNIYLIFFFFSRRKGKLGRICVNFFY